MTSLLAQTSAPIDFVPALDPFGLPAPTWALELLLMFGMLTHFAFMNFVLGGAIIASVLDAHTLTGRANHNATVRVIWQVLPVALSLTITTGVVPLLVVQALFGSFFYTANVFLGLTWCAAVPLLIVAFYAAYALSYKLGNALSGRLGRWNQSAGKRLPISLLCALLFAAVAWILTTNHVLSVQPEQWPHDGQWAQNRLVATPGTSVPRFAHFVAGSLAVAGLWLVCIGWWRKARNLDPPSVTDDMIRVGMLVFVGMVLVAAILGPAFVALLPQEVRQSLFRPNPYAVLWWLGLLGVVVQLVLGYAALRQPRQFRWVCGLIVAAAVSLIGMLAARENVRQAYLGRAVVGFELRDWAIRTQPTSIALFLVFLVLSLIAIGWLLWVSARAPKTPRHEN